MERRFCKTEHMIKKIRHICKYTKKWVFEFRTKPLQTEKVILKQPHVYSSIFIMVPNFN